MKGIALFNFQFDSMRAIDAKRAVQSRENACSTENSVLFARAIYNISNIWLNVPWESALVKRSADRSSLLGDVSRGWFLREAFKLSTKPGRSSIIRLLCSHVRKYLIAPTSVAMRIAASRIFPYSYLSYQRS